MPLTFNNTQIGALAPGPHTHHRNFPETTPLPNHTTSAPGTIGTAKDFRKFDRIVSVGYPDSSALKITVFEGRLGSVYVADKEPFKGARQVYYAEPYEKINWRPRFLFSGVRVERG